MAARAGKSYERLLPSDGRGFTSSSTTNGSGGGGFGGNGSANLSATHAAKLSLSQMSFHHAGVTRSPNQWCASSCVAVTSHCAEPSRSLSNVMSPAFSIAAHQYVVTGTSTRSSFGYGNGTPSHVSIVSRNFGVDSAAARAASARPRVVRIRIGTPPRDVPASTMSNGPTANAIKYLGNGRVRAKRTVFVANAPPLRVSLSIGVLLAAMR